MTGQLFIISFWLGYGFRNVNVLRIDINVNKNGMDIFQWLW